MRSPYIFCQVSSLCLCFSASLFACSIAHSADSRAVSSCCFSRAAMSASARRSARSATSPLFMPAWAAAQRINEFKYSLSLLHYLQVDVHSYFESHVQVQCNDGWNQDCLLFAAVIFFVVVLLLFKLFKSSEYNTMSIPFYLKLL